MFVAARRVEPPQKLIEQQEGRPPTPGLESAVVRECKHHGQVVHYVCKAKTARNGIRFVCRRCAGENVLRRKQLVRRTLIDEAGGCCRVCGYDRYTGNLQFHHVDRASKSFPLGSQQGKSLAAFREEAKKCVLLCANCHGEVEAGLVPSPPLRSST